MADSAPVRAPRFLSLLIAVSIALGAASTAQADAPAAGQPPRGLPLPVADVGGRHFVGSAQCAGCHATETERWTGSHHDLALAKATPATVLGDFGGAELVEGAERFRFVREGDRFFVLVTPADAKPGTEPERHEVAYVIGADPLQQLMVPAPNGRLQVLTVGWSVERGRWLRVLDADPSPRGDAMHWEGRYFSWNTMCADCHGTRIDRGYDPATDAYATTWAEIDVACEACHGRRFWTWLPLPPNPLSP